MIIWFVLFLVVIVISFILAYRSMRDFQHIPSTVEEYGIFLIKNPEGLTRELIDQLHGITLGKKQVLGFERLFKGGQSALVAHIPKKLEGQLKALDLLELEDYTGVGEMEIKAWEVGTKDTFLIPLELGNLFADFPNLEASEQFWWQLTLQPQNSGWGKGLSKTLRSIGSSVGFDKLRSTDPEIKAMVEKKMSLPGWQSQIRAVLIAPDERRNKELGATLQELGKGKLIKLPQSQTSQQIYDSFVKRVVVPLTKHPLVVTANEILQLLGRV